MPEKIDITKHAEDIVGRSKKKGALNADVYIPITTF